jgi:hypothetical protein
MDKELCPRRSRPSLLVAMTTFCRNVIVILPMLLPMGAVAQDIALPSGQSVTLYDVVLEPETARFRFLAPAIDPLGEGRTYEDVMDDFQVLCDSYALPALSQAGKDVPDIVISLSDREVTFGTADPSATQFFEPFSVQDGHCSKEDF